MTNKINIIFDDRIKPGPDLTAIIGHGAFSRIIRRRQRLEDEVQSAIKKTSYPLTILRTEADATRLLNDMETDNPELSYLFLPSCMPPLHMELLPDIIQKLAFALETTFLGPLSNDAAAVLLQQSQAISFLRANGITERRNLLRWFSETASHMINHSQLTDIREIQNLLVFLRGSTETRHFNNSKTEEGIFYKNSSDIQKMKAEYKYFHVAPENMKRFLMPTFSFWEKAEAAGYAMEYLPIPDLALQLIHGAFHPDDFETLLDHFFAFLSARPQGLLNKEAAVEKAKEQILGKLETRLTDFLKTASGQKLDDLLKISGPKGSLRDMQATARPFIQQAIETFPEPALVFGHGDPCFSNILFEKRLGLMRLIDPKGAIHFEDGLMHPLYDVAKFSHSVLGGYDFINNMLFTSDFNKDLVLNYHLDGDGPPVWAQTAFRNRLKDAGIDITAVRAIELSLFLSMLPLHADRPEKLVGFTLIAANIITELENLS